MVPLSARKLSFTVAPVTGLGPTADHDGVPDLTTTIHNGQPVGLGDRKVGREDDRAGAGCRVVRRVRSVVPTSVPTVALLTSEPEASAATVPFSVKVALPPGGNDTEVPMLPDPLAAPQIEPLGAVHVQVTPVRAAGTLSVTGARLATFGPALATVIVYCTAPPGCTAVAPSVFVIDRSAINPGNSSAPAS